MLNSKEDVMKIITSFCLFVLLLSCAQMDTNPIQGTWQLVEGRYVTADTTIIYGVSPTASRIKVIGKTHFATVWQDTASSDPIATGFNGGTYTFSNGIYIEKLDYFSYKDWIGGEAIFKVKIEGDKLTFIPATKEGNEQETGFFDEWRRIE